ncbi:igE-binding protein-like [Cavia porcellus]|uniref:igE-binding protein-like n=1 Tax=Cavia porcellus TaxID=10141 RepID=UPI002FE28C61
MVAPFRAPGPTAPPWPEEELLPGLPPQPMAPPWLEGELLPGLPSAPPSGEGGGRSFHQRVWSRLPFECSGLHAFPVQVGGRGGGGYYEPLEIKQLKAIKDAVSAYGPNAPFTMALLEALAGLLLTPGDWTQLARACLSPGFCVEQAAANRENNQREWNRDMLLGRGTFEEDQTQYPRQVYEQISRCGLQAWRRLAGKGERATHAINHCLAAWAAWGKPNILKTDNGPAYTSKTFVTFCQQMDVVLKHGIPYNPQGQGIIERAHRTLKGVLQKQKEGIGHGLTPKGRISLALFTISFPCHGAQ